MQKGFRIGAIAGALTIALSGSAFAASTTDLSFGGWTASGGNVNGLNADVCTQGKFSCKVITGGADNTGFAQIEVDPINTTNDSSYIMTIVADQNASTGSNGLGDLGFYDVNFVPMTSGITGGNQVSQNSNGIYGMQVLSSTGTQGSSSFSATTNLNTGWAQGSGSPISLSQNITDNNNTATTNDDFASSFYYASGPMPLDASGNPTGPANGFVMSIDQMSGLGDSNSTAGANVQSFAYREKQGSFVATNGSSPLGVAWTGNGTASGDDIKAVWLGQKIDIPTFNGGPGIGGDFGYVGFTNVTTTDAASQVGFTSPTNGPTIWDSEFNIANSPNGTGKPCLADPTGASCP